MEVDILYDPNFNILRNLMYVFCFLGLFSCKKENNSDDNPMQGLWISNNKDTLEVNGLIKYVNANPYTVYNFGHQVLIDSLFLFPIQSSCRCDWKGYYYNLKGSKLLLYNFFSHNELEFNKIK